MLEDQKIKKATHHLWTFSISKLISTFGNSIFAFGISLYVLTLTGSAMGFALNLICSILPRTLLSPFTGYIADRYSKKMIIIFSQSLAAITVGGLLIFSLVNPLNVFVIYLTTALLSICSMFTGITFTSAIANLIDDERIQKAMAFNQASVSASTILGPIIGGIMYGIVSFEVFLLVHIISYSIAVLLESTMNFTLYSNKQNEEWKEGMLSSIVSGFKYLKTHDILWTLMCTALIINFFSACFIVGYPYIVVEELGIKSTHFGIIEGTFAVGMLLASLFLSQRKNFRNPLVVVKRGIIIITVIIGATTFPIFFQMGYEINVFYYIVTAMLYGGTLAFINTPVGVMFQKKIHEEYKGRVFGFLETMTQAMSPIAMILYGFSFDYFGIVPSTIVSAICLMCVTLFMLKPSVIIKASPKIENQSANV